MIRNIILSAVCVSLVACGNDKVDSPVAPSTPSPTSTSTPTAPKSQTLVTSDYSPSLAKFMPLELGMSLAQAETVIREAYHGTGEGVRSVSVSVTDVNDDRATLLATQEGMGDDSVDSEQLYATFETNGSGDKVLTFYGLRIRCARGTNTTEWQTEACP